jgi:hypothetical protein
MHPLLESIRKHPGMYLGPNKASLAALCAFFTGYQCGYWAGSPKPHAPSVPADSCLLPEDFDQFVAQRLGERWPTGKSMWSFIREHTETEKEAFELFFRLVDEYEKKRPNDYMHWTRR